MEVFQVIMKTDVLNYANRDEDYKHEIDEGLFASLKAADQYIEKKSKQELDAAVHCGDGAWINAYPSEVIDENVYENVGYLRKSIMIHFLKDGQFCRLDYYVLIRTVKDAV